MPRPSHADALARARKAGGGVATWTIDLPSYGPPVSSNARRGRGRWNERRVLAEWRECAHRAVRAAAVPPLPHVHMQLRIIPPDRRKRDEDNYVALLAKPVKDGVGDALLMPDDTAEYITWQIVIDSSTTGRKGWWQYQLVLSEKPIRPEQEGVSA